MEFVVRVAVHLACFGVAMWSLSSLQFEKFIRRGKPMEAQVLYILIAMAIGFLAAQFLLSLLR